MAWEHSIRCRSVETAAWHWRSACVEHCTGSFRSKLMRRNGLHSWQGFAIKTFSRGGCPPQTGRAGGLPGPASTGPTSFMLGLTGRSHSAAQSAGTMCITSRLRSWGADASKPCRLLRRTEPVRGLACCSTCWTARQGAALAGAILQGLPILQMASTTPSKSINGHYIHHHLMAVRLVP